MTVAELREALKAWPEEALVYVDWDPEGGHENVVGAIHAFTAPGVKKSGVKIAQY